MTHRPGAFGVVYGVAEDGSSGGSAAGQTVLVAASAKKFNDRLLHALRRQSPQLGIEDIRRVGPAGLARAISDRTVSLILVEAGFLEASQQRIAELRKRQPRVCVAVLLNEGERINGAVWDAALSNSIQGVVPTNLKVEVVVAILKLLLQGIPYFPRWFFRPSLSPVSAPQARRVVPSRHKDLAGLLTDREMEILEHLSQGMPNKLIAVTLGLSEYTVKVHVQNILRKLEVDNRTSAAALFLEQDEH